MITAIMRDFTINLDLFGLKHIGKPKEFSLNSIKKYLK